MVYYLTTANMT